MSIDKLANQSLALNKVFKSNDNNVNSVSGKVNDHDNSKSLLSVQSEKDSSSTQKAFFQAKQGMLKDLFGVQDEASIKTPAFTQETSKATVGSSNKEKAPEELDQTKKQEQTGLSKSIGTEDKGSQKVVDDNRSDEEKKPVVEAVKTNNSLLQQQTQINSVENNVHIG